MIKRESFLGHIRQRFGKPIPVLNVQQLQEIQRPRKDSGKKKKENKDLDEI